MLTSIRSASFTRERYVLFESFVVAVYRLGLGFVGSGIASFFFWCLMCLILSQVERSEEGISDV